MIPFYNQLLLFNVPFKQLIQIVLNIRVFWLFIVSYYTLIHSNFIPSVMSNNSWKKRFYHLEFANIFSPWEFHIHLVVCSFHDSFSWVGLYKIQKYLPFKASIFSIDSEVCICICKLCSFDADLQWSYSSFIYFFFHST